MAENLIYKILESIPAFRKRYHKISHDISGYLYHVLNDREIKQNEFALRMKKSESEISKWLSGYHNFTIKTIAKIESELGIEIIQVPFYDKEEKEKVDYQYYVDSNKETDLPYEDCLSLYKPDEKKEIFQTNADEFTNLIFSEYIKKKIANS